MKSPRSDSGTSTSSNLSSRSNSSADRAREIRQKQQEQQEAKRKEIEDRRKEKDSIAEEKLKESKAGKAQFAAQHNNEILSPEEIKKQQEQQQEAKRKDIEGRRTQKDSVVDGNLKEAKASKTKVATQHNQVHIPEVLEKAKERRNSPRDMSPMSTSNSKAKTRSKTSDKKSAQLPSNLTNSSEESFLEEVFEKELLQEEVVTSAIISEELNKIEQQIGEVDLNSEIAEEVVTQQNSGLTETDLDVLEEFEEKEKSVTDPVVLNSDSNSITNQSLEEDLYGNEGFEEIDSLEDKVIGQSKVPVEEEKKLQQQDLEEDPYEDETFEEETLINTDLNSELKDIQDPVDLENSLTANKEIVADLIEGELGEIEEIIEDPIEENSLSQSQVRDENLTLDRPIPQELEEQKSKQSITSEKLPPIDLNAGRGKDPFSEEDSKELLKLLESTEEELKQEVVEMEHSLNPPESLVVSNVVDSSQMQSQIEEEEKEKVEELDKGRVPDVPKNEKSTQATFGAASSFTSSLFQSALSPQQNLLQPNQKDLDLSLEGSNLAPTLESLAFKADVDSRQMKPNPIEPQINEIEEEKGILNQLINGKPPEIPDNEIEFDNEDSKNIYAKINAALLSSETNDQEKAAAIAIITNDAKDSAAKIYGSAIASVLIGDSSFEDKNSAISRTQEEFKFLESETEISEEEKTNLLQQAKENLLQDEKINEKDKERIGGAFDQYLGVEEEVDLELEEQKKKQQQTQNSQSNSSVSMDDPEKFQEYCDKLLKEHGDKYKLNLKSAAIDVARIGAAASMAALIPGVGPMIAVAFFIATRNYGKDQGNEKEDSRSKDMEEAMEILKGADSAIAKAEEKKKGSGSKTKESSETVRNQGKGKPPESPRGVNGLEDDLENVVNNLGTEATPTGNRSIVHQQRQNEGGSR